MAYSNPYLDGSNPYLQGQIDAAQSDVVRNYDLSTQPAYNSAMVKSGSFGNSGVQQMNENAQRNMQQSLGDISTSMRNTDYLNRQGMYKWDQEFDRNVFNDAFGQNQSNVQLGMGLLGALNGYNAQDLANATTIQNTPQQYYGQFANYANAAGGMGQTVQSTVGTSSSPFTSALGGAQLGSSLTRYWNNGSPGTGSAYWAPADYSTINPESQRIMPQGGTSD